jgi:hypothetical protein
VPPPFSPLVIVGYYSSINTTFPLSPLKSYGTVGFERKKPKPPEFGGFWDRGAQPLGIGMVGDPIEACATGVEGELGAQKARLVVQRRPGGSWSRSPFPYSPNAVQ